MAGSRGTTIAAIVVEHHGPGLGPVVIPLRYPEKAEESKSSRVAVSARRARSNVAGDYAPGSEPPGYIQQRDDVRDPQQILGPPKENTPCHPAGLVGDGADIGQSSLQWPPVAGPALIAYLVQVLCGHIETTSKFECNRRFPAAPASYDVDALSGVL
ncbi:MAG: hypothetical protein IH861_16435, partial [Chloroflexi bacterium]|nr:hypothetical protein [Chloroflexota bacterium]